MKVLRSMLLAALLVGAAPVVGQDKPAPVVQYDLGSCGGQDFTVEHVTINRKDKIVTLDYFMPAPDQVVKEDPAETPAFKDYAEVAEKNGSVSFSASTDFKPSDGKTYRLELHGVMLNDRAVAVLTVDGNLGRVYYGKQGNVDQMVVVVEDYAAYCGYIHEATSEQDLMERLIEFLTPKDSGASKS